MAEIALDQVRKVYPDGHAAVRDLDLSVRDGELMVLVGPSGCGKSTVLRMVAGLEEVSEGELRIGGEVVNDRPPKDRDVAMVFQSYALYPHMTVRDNMSFALKLGKVDRGEIGRRVAEAARVLQLDEHLDRRPGQLSGGQRQRVAMGRAMVREPAAFLLDEPLSNLDAKLRTEMRTEVGRIQSTLGTTAIYVTHDQTEAMTLGDRIAVMHDGVLEQVGSPAEIYDHPANMFVAGFIGSPSMNFLPARLEADALVLPFAEIGLSRTLRRLIGDHGPELVAGIRPETFEDAALVGEAAGGTVFDAEIEVLEPIGSEIYAVIEDPEWRLIVRLDPSSSLREREPGRLWFDSHNVHLFDPATGTWLATTESCPASPASNGHALTGGVR